MTMVSTAITAKRLFDGTILIDNPLLIVEEGCFASISTRGASALPPGARLLDYPGATLAPAFLDIHIHGAAGHDVMEATPGALAAMERFLASRGTGGYLATTVTAPLDVTLRALDGLAQLSEHPKSEGVARLLGIHLEGPFLSHEKRGVQPGEHLLAPNIATFDRLFDASRGHVRLMTVAPELPGALELIAHATKRGIRVSLGHSNATTAETRAAVAAGAVSATHTFNAMRALDHREPGILGTVLTDDSLYSELICDGVHSQPEITQLWWRSKGPERTILVTDAISATGMPDGKYQLGGITVQVAHGRAMREGVLAGSVLTLDRALQNFIAFAGATVDQALRLVTTNPARMLEIENRAGHLAPGLPANLVAVSQDGALIESFVNGIPVSGSPA